MDRFNRKSEARRSASVEENRRLGKKRVQSAARQYCEALEKRLLFNAGGGWTGSGLAGQYYNNTTWTGTPAFTRTDVRLDTPDSVSVSGAANPGAPGGTPQDANYAAVGTTNWSAKWTGSLIPKYTENYTFRYFSSDSLSMTINGTTIVNQTASTGAWATATFAATANTTYSVAIEYAQATGPWGLQLHWLSTGANPFSEEAIEPATPVGVNLEPDPKMFADATKFAAQQTGAKNPTDGWPSSDFSELFFYLGGEFTVNVAGTYLLQFTGEAQITDPGGPILDFKLTNGTDIGATVTSGTGFNSTTGLTTVQMVVPDMANYNGLPLHFANTQRTSGSSLSTGVTNIHLMRPTTLGGTTDYPVGTLLTTDGLDEAAPFTTLRMMDWNFTNIGATNGVLHGNYDVNWPDRNPAAGNYWAVKTDGMPWETDVAIANATGKDLYINIPALASPTYIADLANLITYGSDGTTPYTSIQTNPVWAPLNPNLKVYIEFSNEIWNSGFDAGGTRSDGWANQLSQLAVYDYETGNMNDPSYPGGGANAYNDGALIAPQFITGGNLAAWEATYNASAPNPNTADSGAAPAWFSNGDSSLNGYSIYNGWVALRLEQISTIFKTALGETTVNAASQTSRVRPLFEWQYGGSWDGALSQMNSMFGSLHPVDYYLYGGGGGWYSDNGRTPSTEGFNDALFSNPNFDSGLTGWTSTGTTGTTTNGGGMGNPTAPTEVAPGSPAKTTTNVAYLAPNSSISQSVTFSGGDADITLYAAQTTSESHENEGLLLYVNGVQITPSEGGEANSFSEGHTSSYGWLRSAAFNTTAGAETITFKNIGPGTVFLSDVGIQTVNGMFAQEAAKGQSPITTVMNDAIIASHYGLYDVGYEGGFDFNESLGYDDINGYSDMGAQGYTGTIPNVGMEANLDPRTDALAQNTIDDFYAYGGTLPVVFESGGNINSWGVYAPSIYSSPTAPTSIPKVEAIAAVGTVLPQPSLPAGWTNTVIGQTSTTSTTDYGIASGPNSAGNWTIESTNPNNTGFAAPHGTTSDQYDAVTTPVSGNVILTAEMTSDGAEAAGLVMQSSLAANSPEVALTSNESGGYFMMSSRTGTGTTMVTYQNLYGGFVPPASMASAPVWMELVETGDVFTGYLSSTDGNWSQVGVPVTLTSGNFPTGSFFAGLANDSNGGTWPSVAVSTFQNVSVNTFFESQYLLDGNGNDSIGSNNATATGTVTWDTTHEVQGTGSLSLPGNSAAALTAPDSTTLDNTSALTISAWIRPTSLASGTGAIVDKRNGFENGEAYDLFLWDNGTNTFNLYADIGDNGTGGTNITRFHGNNATWNLNQWYFVTLVYSGGASPTASLYVNGLLDGTTSLGSTYNVIGDKSSPLYIGGGAGSSTDFAGNIDDVQITNQVSTADQVAALYRAGAPGSAITSASATSGTSITVNWTSVASASYILERSTDSTFATGLTTFTPAAGVTSEVDTTLTAGTTYYYRIAAVEPSGVQSFWSGTAMANTNPEAEYLLDSNGNDLTGNHNATATGTVTWDTTNKVQGTASLSLPGNTGAYLSAPDSSALDDTSALTVSAWIRPTALATSDGAIVAKRNAYENGEAYTLSLYNGGSGSVYNLYADIGDNTTNGVVTRFHGSNSTWNLNQWYLVTLVYNGGASPTASLYVNGVLDGTTSLTSAYNMIGDKSSPLYIGDSGAGLSTDFAGNIDDVRIYRNALGISDIEDLYNATNPNLGVATYSASTHGTFATNAFDGNPATSWTSITAGQEYLMTDLGSSQTVNDVLIDWGSSSTSAAAGRFQILVGATSTMSSATVVYDSGTTGLSPGGLTDATNLNATGRYVWLVMLVPSTTLNYNVAEMSVLG